MGCCSRVGWPPCWPPPWSSGPPARSGLEALGALGAISLGPMLAWASDVSRCRRGRSLAPSLRLVEICPMREQRPSFRWDAVIGLAGVLAAALLFGMRSLLLAVKVVSDGPIYHLYFAARWWKAGRLILVAAPFGENAATYFPANGDLWFTWLMASWGGDRLAKVGQAPVPGPGRPGGVRVCASARRGPIGQRGCDLLVRLLDSALALLVRAQCRHDLRGGLSAGRLLFSAVSLGEGDTAAVILGALAAGVALGTKAVGVVFIPPLLALAIGGILVQSGAGSNQNRSDPGDRAGSARVGRVLVHSQRVTHRQSPLSAGSPIVGPYGVARLVWARSDALQSVLRPSEELEGARRSLGRQPGPEAGAALDRRIGRIVGIEEPEYDGQKRLDCDLLVNGGRERCPVLGLHSVPYAMAVHAPRARPGSRAVGRISGSRAMAAPTGRPLAWNPSVHEPELAVSGTRGRDSVGSHAISPELLQRSAGTVRKVRTNSSNRCTIIERRSVLEHRAVRSVDGMGLEWDFIPVDSSRTACDCRGGARSFPLARIPRGFQWSDRYAARVLPDI